MQSDYLIPANSKKSALILGVFNKADLLLFGCGIVVTLGLIFAVSASSIVALVIKVAPACITGFMVLPIPNYHNVFTLIVNIYKFFTNQRKYKWKGWCASNGKDSTSN